MAVVRDLVTRLGFQVDNRGRTRAEGAITRIRDRANDAAVQVRGMLAAFVGFQGLRGLANVADNVQSLEARMGQMTQTAGTAGEAFDAVAARATAARQDLDAYANLYIRIGNATQGLIKDQDSLLGVIDTISQAMVVGGVASSEQASAMLQLSQAFNKGKLDGDEFRAVMEAMPRAFTEGLAGAMGYTDGLASFMEASRNGELTTEMLVKALQEIGPSIKDQFLAMPMTLSQAFTVINNRFSGFVARMNRESGAVTKAANFFLDAFDAIEGALESLVSFLGGPTNALKAFGIVLAAVLAPMVINAFAGALALLVSPIGLVVAGLTLLGLIIEDVYQWVTGGESVIGGFLGTFEDWKAANADLIQSLSELWDSIKAFWGQMANLGASVWDILVGLFTADVGLISSGFDGVLNALSGLFDAWLANIKAAFSASWEILKTIAGSLWDVSPMKAWIDAIKGMIPAIKNYFLDMLSPVTDIFNKAAGFLGFGDSGSDQSANTAAPVYGPEVPVVAPGGNSTNVNQTINVTVPPGTPEQQQQAIKDGASKAFGDPMNKLTNGMGAYTR